MSRPGTPRELPLVTFSDSSRCPSCRQPSRLHDGYLAFREGFCSANCQAATARLANGSRRRQGALQPVFEPAALLSPAASRGTPDGASQAALPAEEAGAPQEALPEEEAFSDAVEDQLGEPDGHFERQADDLMTNSADSTLASSAEATMSQLLDESVLEMERILAQGAMLNAQERLRVEEMLNAQERLRVSIANRASRHEGAHAAANISPIPFADQTGGAEDISPNNFASQGAISVTTPQRRSSHSHELRQAAADSMAATADTLDSGILHSDAGSGSAMSGSVNSTSQQRAQMMQAAEARRFMGNVRGTARGRCRGVAPSSRVQQIAPTALFTQPTQKSAGSAPLSLPMSVNAPSSSMTTADSFYGLGLRMASAAQIPTTVYARQFCDTLSRLVHAHECEIVFLEGSSPRITSIESISLQSDSSLLVTCSRKQFRNPTVFHLRSDQLWILPHGQLGSDIQSASSIQPLSSLFQETVAQCSVLTASAAAAPAADPLQQFRGENCDAGGRDQEVSSTGFSDYSRRGARRRREDDDFSNDGSGQDIYQAPHGYGQRPPGANDRAKHEPFKKWAAPKAQIYKGDCYLTEDLNDVTAEPSRWLIYIAEQFTFYAIEKRYWVAAALYAVTRLIKERFIRMCQDSTDLLPMPWEGYMEHLSRADVDVNGHLPLDHPLSWHVFSIWLEAEFTDLGLGQKQITFVKNMRQTAGQATTTFNTSYQVELDRLRKLQEILPEDEREKFNSAAWRQNYIRSLLPAVADAVSKHLSEVTAKLLETYNAGAHGLSFAERMREKQRINLGFDGKTLEQVMIYAGSMDRMGQLSNRVDYGYRRTSRTDFSEERASSSVSRGSSASLRSSSTSSRSYGSSPSSSSRPLRRFTQLAIMDDPAKEIDEPADATADSDEEEYTPEVFFGQMIRQPNAGRVVWSREQIMKLRARDLCFRCAKPNCVARTCKNPPANPRDVTLTNITLEGPVYFLPEDDEDLLHLLVDYDGRLNEKPQQQH